MPHKKPAYYKLSFIQQLVVLLYSLCGHKGKVVASHAAVSRSIPAEIALSYSMHEALMGYCP